MICLDVLRSMNVELSSVGAFMHELGQVSGADERYDALVEDLKAELANNDQNSLQRRARLVVDKMAIALQAVHAAHGSYIVAAW